MLLRAAECLVIAATLSIPGVIYFYNMTPP